MTMSWRVWRSLAEVRKSGAQIVLGISINPERRIHLPDQKDPSRTALDVFEWGCRPAEG
jgi:hypothetical protein